MKTFIFIALALAFTACACSKKLENQLPRATQKGANTFGFIMNGTVYKCSGYKAPNNMFLDEGVYFGYSNATKRLAILASVKEPKSNFIIEVYEFEQAIGIFRKVYFEHKLISQDAESYVKITKYDNGVLSGVFQFNTDEGKVENGRFDIKKP